MFRFRHGRFWKVAVVTKDFRSPAPRSAWVKTGAIILYRVYGHEVIFGDGDPHTVEDIHSLLHELARPVWPWKFTAPLKVQENVRPLRLANPVHYDLPHLTPWLETLIEDRDALKDACQVDDAWVDKLHAGVLVEDPLFDNFDWGEPQDKPGKLGVDAGKRIRPKEDDPGRYVLNAGERTPLKAFASKE